MNALRSANFAKLSSNSATSDEYWLTSMSAGTPGGYCLSQIRSMGLSPHDFRCLLYCFRLRRPGSPCFRQYGHAAEYGKRLRAIDALVCQAQARLMAAKPLKSRVERFRAKWVPGWREENAPNQESIASA